MRQYYKQLENEYGINFMEILPILRLENPLKVEPVFIEQKSLNKDDLNFNIDLFFPLPEII